jgi:hypothetical protein
VASGEFVVFSTHLSREAAGVHSLWIKLGSQKSQFHYETAQLKKNLGLVTKSEKKCMI